MNKKDAIARLIRVKDVLEADRSTARERKYAALDVDDVIDMLKGSDK